jgi:hypothetical protein
MAFVTVESIAARTCLHQTRRDKRTLLRHRRRWCIGAPKRRHLERVAASAKPDARGNLNPVIARCMSTLLVFGFAFASLSGPRQRSRQSRQRSPGPLFRRHKLAEGALGVLGHALWYRIRATEPRLYASSIVLNPCFEVSRITSCPGSWRTICQMKSLGRATPRALTTTRYGSVKGVGSRTIKPIWRRHVRPRNTRLRIG